MVDQYFSDLASDADQRGVHSTSGLRSAIGAPRQTFDRKDLHFGVLTKAAALMRSLIENHPFINGNKRTAVISTVIFLEDNGYELTVPDRKLLRLATGVALGMSLERIERWLKKYTHRSHPRLPIHRVYAADFLQRLRGRR